MSTYQVMFITHTVHILNYMYIQTGETELQESSFKNIGEVHKYEIEMKPPQKLGGPFILRK